MNSFKAQLINWFDKNKRDLPWRGTGNPYDTLLSEFILQQTRIEQGKPYFLRLKEAFPTIEKLAFSSEESVLCLWQGLGYYSRARNLHASAKAICEKFNGNIPNNVVTLRQLKGIGDYTAAAIASIAFNQPVPLIDGNVFRVISRIFAIETPIDTTLGKKEIQTALESVFDFENAGKFNEAMMDFGAMQCVPANPNCKECPMLSFCKAYQTQRVEQFPVKQKQTPVKTRFLNYLVIMTDEKKAMIILQKRVKNDIWKNLYEFPLIETEEEIQDEVLQTDTFWNTLQLFSKPIQFQEVVRKSHKLTHRLLKVSFVIAKTDSKNLTVQPPYFQLYYSDFQKKPLPILLSKFLTDYIKTAHSETI